jgi:hypothetical protein
LLFALIEQADKTEEDEALNLLYFAARCLEFMVPSPRVTRQITTACIERCIGSELERIEKEKTRITNFGQMSQPNRKKRSGVF